MSWASNAETARASAAQADLPYLLFFCDPDTAKFAGVGTNARRAMLREHKGRVPAFTAFDNIDVVEALKRLNLTCAKVPLAQDNVELVRKMGIASDRTLVLCAPTGEAIASLPGMSCVRENVLGLLRNIRVYYTAWKHRKAGANPLIK